MKYEPHFFNYTLCLNHYSFCFHDLVISRIMNANTGSFLSADVSVHFI